MGGKLDASSPAITHNRIGGVHLFIKLMKNSLDYSSIATLSRQIFRQQWSDFSVRIRLVKIKVRSEIHYRREDLFPHQP